jgi:hypothetical protein
VIVKLKLEGGVRVRAKALCIIALVKLESWFSNSMDSDDNRSVTPAVAMLA